MPIQQRGWRWLRAERGSQSLEAAGAALAAALIVLALLAGARSTLGPRVVEAFQCAAAALGGGGGGCGNGAAADTTGTPAQPTADKQDDGGFGWLDGLQVVLDGVGLVPVLGEIADGANGVISLLRGDTTGAMLSFGAMIPIGGWFATGGKFVRNGVRYSDEAAAGARSGDDVAGAATRCATHRSPGKGPGLAKPLYICATAKDVLDRIGSGAGKADLEADLASSGWTSGPAAGGAKSGVGLIWTSPNGTSSVRIMTRPDGTSYARVYNGPGGGGPGEQALNASGKPGSRADTHFELAP